MSGMLVIRPRNGLCNRMRVLASFAALARRSGRELRVCWTGSRGWSDEDLAELFENPFARVSVQEYEALSADALPLHEHVAVGGVGGLSQTWWDSGAPGFAGVFDTQSYPVVTYAGFERCHDLIAPERRRRLLPRFNDDFEAELRRLRPVGEIRQQVAELAAAFDAATVGVHIRRGDALQGSWLQAGVGPSTDAAFMHRMDRILARRPRTAFFLATDSPGTEQRFVARYGPHVITNPGKRFVPSLPGARKDNQRDAVIDLYALAQTRKILGSYYSTFSTTAASIGGIPIQVALEGSWVMRQRRVLRYARSELLRRGGGLLERLRLS